MVNMEPLMATSILPAMTREGETFTEGVLDCLTLMQIIKGGYRHMAALRMQNADGVELSKMIIEGGNNVVLTVIK